MAIIIGKEGNQPFVITSAGVSRKHAQITIDHETWFIEDLNSTNGTFVQNEDGDYIRIINMQIRAPFHPA